MTTPAKDLYIISEGDASTFLKIGESGNVQSRKVTLQTGNPRHLHVLHVVPGAAYLETPLHDYFAARHVSGEWFDFGNDDPVERVLAAIKEIDAQGALNRAVAEARRQAREEALAEAEERAAARVRQERDRVTRERDQQWRGRLLAQQAEQQERETVLRNQITELQQQLAGLAAMLPSVEVPDQLPGIQDTLNGVDTELFKQLVQQQAFMPRMPTRRIAA